ncbi:hypothetical protein ACFW04_010496 [Cataglyphis niger]
MTFLSLCDKGDSLYCKYIKVKNNANNNNNNNNNNNEK